MSVLLADIDATCAALGYSDGKRYQAEPDALHGLKHLIWILRRDLDNHEYRRHLGRSKVLQTDLVYMLPDYVDDEEFADVLIRLLVILTNPTLLLYRDGPPKDHHGRRVYLELIDILQGYKSAFARDKIWTALFGKLQKAMEIDWAMRSEEQSLLIERILVLMRNVLQVPANPEAECRADNDASVHDQVIWALHQTGMLDLVLFVVSSPDEHQFHLHALEILCLLYREQTAESLADASLQRSAAEKQRDEQELLAVRRREKQRLQARPPPARHSRFGGTFVIRNLKSVSDRDIICHQPLERVATIDFDREKEQQRRNFRHVKEEALTTRRSAFSVRLCLREYCIEVLRSAYNTLVRQVRRVLERNSGSSGHDDSYLLWAIRFFMEFNRLCGLQLQFVSESLSVQCFHWVLTRMQHDMDMIGSDKKQARLWAKRLHVALQTFRELLLSLLALQKLQDENARALFDMLLNNVCYVLEYRETILHLLMNYNEAHSTKVFLRDVVETANIFIKMMEKFCKDSVVVQDKRRGKRAGGKKKTAAKPAKSADDTEEELANKWAALAEDVSGVLNADELPIPEEEMPLPFDAASEKSIDDQKEDCMIRINKLLRAEKLDQAVALLRAGREVWPENDVFGAYTAAPEDELLLLREIFMHNITTADDDAEPKRTEDDRDGQDENECEQEEYGEPQDSGVIEKAFQFEDFAKRLLNPKIVRACTVVLGDWQHIPTKSLKATVTILHRIAYGCSCPALLYQAKLFRIFQEVFGTARDSHQEELRRLGIYVVRKFVEIAPNNPKIYAELLFFKSIKEANELESGYCDAYETGAKGAWSEEQETELRVLFEENQRNPETDKDVIDWIIENLIDKTRTRRGVLKKMKELGLMFKAPTKKSTASAAQKQQWRSEEDDELQSLYDQYRLEDDCLQRIVDEFGERHNKQQIIKRMLQLHMIADKSEILPQKPRKRNPHKKRSHNSDVDHDDDMEEPQVRHSKAKKAAKKRKVVRTPLVLATIRNLLAQIDEQRFQGAIEWLRECLSDAADDCEEDAGEDDGVPLVPMFEVQNDAMEDAAFQRLLVALGIQPPIAGMENYWRIPTYLNEADLKLRADVVAGNEVQIDDEVDDEGDDEGDEEGDDEGDDEGARSDKAAEESEDHVQRQKRNLDKIMYSKSDDEVAERTPLKPKKQRLRKPKMKPQSDAGTSSEGSEDEVDFIQQKLVWRQRNPDVSSDEESDRAAEKVKKKKKKTKKPKQPTKPKGVDSEQQFAQLKKQRAKDRTLVKDNQGATEDSDGMVTEIEQKLQKKRHNLELSSDDDAAADAGSLFDLLKTQRSDKAKGGKPLTASESHDELDFNTEDYRLRLLELGDSDSDEGEAHGTDNDETITAANVTKNRQRRVNIIDSDSEEEPREGAREDVVKEQRGVVVVDKAGNQANGGRATQSAVDNGEHEHDDSEGDGDGGADGAGTLATATATAANNKRRRSSERDSEHADNETATRVAGEDDNDDDDDEAAFLVRKKPTKAERALIASGEQPAKRRRAAIIDDDEDDD